MAKIRRFHLYGADMPEAIRALSKENEYQKVFVCGKEAAFTKQEFDFLQLLLTHISKVFTYKHICEIVWGNEYEKQNSNALWCLASKVRKKISALGGAGGIIQTVCFVGYRIE